VALKVSTSRKPSAVQLKGFYAHAWWTKGRSLAQVRSLLKHSDLIVTAWEGRELVGFARVGTDFCFRAVIWDVIVHPGQHRRGIGSRLIKAITSHPKLAGVESFWLFTSDKQPFYKKLGFEFFPKNLMVYRTRRAKVRP
jgi:N-acetylglutamate synthase-like GNAT family acetyltransferase